MAIPGGYRFKIPFDDVFPQGCYVMSVERAKVRTVERVVKIAASYQPEPLAAIRGDAVSAGDLRRDDGGAQHVVGEGHAVGAAG